MHWCVSQSEAVFQTEDDDNDVPLVWPVSQQVNGLLINN